MALKACPTGPFITCTTTEFCDCVPFGTDRLLKWMRSLGIAKRVGIRPNKRGRPSVLWSVPTSFELRFREVE